MDVPHDLILHQELHELPFFILQIYTQRRTCTCEGVRVPTEIPIQFCAREPGRETHHSAVADVDLPEVPGEIGLVAAPTVAGDAEGVGPAEPRRGGGRRTGGRRGGEREAAAGEELEAGGGAPATGAGDGGHGGGYGGYHR